jgi:hypothetical protein
MARLSPTIEEIDLLTVSPTNGERYLLNFLSNTLDDSYEVFFQPYLNGDNPDVIILRENSGVLIIEVKDWNLDSYELNERRNWTLKNIQNKSGKKQIVKSPIQQVFEYKENIYNLHIDSLLEKRINNYKLLSIVTCAVYFHNSTKNQIDSFLTKDYLDNKGYISFLSHFEILGRDSLSTENFNKIISKRWLDKKSYYFDNLLYKSFKRYLKPPFHLVEEGKSILYTDEQERIIESYSSRQQKIKGVAGSGKTLALAKRAVNAHLRHNGDVLILTFNISLRNYIHDRINEVRQNFNWKYFTILHYHQFIKSHFNNINFDDSDSDSDITTLIVDGKKYKTIIIDEIQDYQKDWITIVKCFLTQDSEFVVFGDEKQNIYQRSLEEKKPYTSISGQWNILKKSFRIPTDIANLATNYQKTFFSDKYEFDEIIVQKELFDQSMIKYFKIEEVDIQKIIDIYKTIINEFEIHDNDVCFQSSHVEILRYIEKAIRDNLHKKTNTMFESFETYESIKQTNTKDEVVDEKHFKQEIDNVRRHKKFNFWMNSGTTKFSTIHSFKGWEIPTLFLIIEKEENNGREFTSDELIYTAITRCSQNLIIINIDNSRYDQFFSRYIDT